MNCSGNKSIRIWLTIALSAAFISFVSRSMVACQVEGNDAKVAQPADSREAISNDQTRLAEQYRLLEEKLFALYQYEQGQNPERSKLLQNAWQQSQEKLTLKQLESALQMIQQSRLRDAEKHQTTAIENIELLLELLQSGDRSTKLREDRDRYREYLKELERIERIQQGVRGRAEAPLNQNGDVLDSKDLEAQQVELAQRTADLQSQIGKERDADSEGPQDSGSDASSETDPGNVDENGDPGNPPPADSALQKAQQHMEQAQRALDESGREKAVEPMRDAERELARAREEMEKILRQLREEEIERSLASLESRFRQMMEFQLRIQEETRRLDLKTSETDNKTRSAEVEMESNRLAGNERELVAEADRALLVLEDDGSSIATIESLRQVRTDLQQLADRLAASRTGETTQQIQDDVIEILSQMIKAFESAQNDSSKVEAKSAEGAGQSPGQQALIDQLAELKLVRSLQQRILLRHQRYAALLVDSEDLMGHSDEPDVRDALKDLAQRQSQLFKITRDIVAQQLRRQAGDGNLP